MRIEYRKVAVKANVDDALIQLANKNKLIVPSTLVLNPLLHANKIMLGPKTEGLITGTIIALEAKNTPFRKEVLWKPSKNIVKRYIVPTQFAGNENCGLVSEQGFDGQAVTVNVEVKTKKGTVYVTYEIDPKYITCVPNMPEEKKGYFPEKQFGLPTTVLQGPDAMMLRVNVNRKRPFIGPVGRRNGSPDHKSAPADMVDMNLRAFRPVAALLVQPEDYGAFVKCSEKMHKEMLEPVLMVSNTGDIHVTLGYGIPDRLRLEKCMFRIAKMYPKDMDPDTVNAMIEMGKRFAMEPAIAGDKLGIHARINPEGMTDYEKMYSTWAACAVKNGKLGEKLEVSILVGQTMDGIKKAIGAILPSQ